MDYTIDFENASSPKAIANVMKKLEAGSAVEVTGIPMISTVESGTAVMYAANDESNGQKVSLNDSETAEQYVQTFQTTLTDTMDHGPRLLIRGTFAAQVIPDQREKESSLDIGERRTAPTPIAVPNPLKRVA